MKIIDLLNKIANGEEVPEKIRFEGKIFEKQDETSFYCTGFGIFELAFVLEDLNKEVEIIEEDKKIKKLDLYWLNVEENNITKDLKLTYNGVSRTFQETRDKINELIDKVNSLENKQ